MRLFAGVSGAAGLRAGRRGGLEAHGGRCAYARHPFAFDGPFCFSAVRAGAIGCEVRKKWLG